MFYRTIFVCLVGFVFVKLVKMDPMEITFQIFTEQLNGKPTLNCDHSDAEMLQNIYTVHEGDNLNISIKYGNMINHFICQDYPDAKIKFLYGNSDVNKTVFTFKVNKDMGTLWKCTILAHKDGSTIKPVVKFESIEYAAAYCYMKIHVRQIEAPQTILVNNMVMPAVRTSLSDKLVDLIAEYQYADGDVVAITCANSLKDSMLTMEYDMAGTISDNSTMEGLSSSKAISLVTKMNSAHNNSYMICTYTGKNDYTKVMVRFIKRTKFQIVSIKINGKNLRPNLTKAENNYYSIEYKYQNSQPIKVLCKIEQRTDVKLMVLDEQFGTRNVKSYKRKDLNPNNKTSMSFKLDPNMQKKLACSADYHNGKMAEQVAIYFSDGNFPIEKYPLDMKFLSNGTVMKLYSDYELKIIFYEFEDDETLNLQCGTLQRKDPGPNLYLELTDSRSRFRNVCEKNGCNVSKPINIIRKGENNDIVCYVKEKADPSKGETKDSAHREIRMIFRRRPLTST